MKRLTMLTSIILISCARAVVPAPRPASVVYIRPAPPADAVEDPAPLSEEWRIATAMPSKGRCHFYATVRDADGERLMLLTEIRRLQLEHHDAFFRCD